jgi:hypothetical protein
LYCVFEAQNGAKTHLQARIDPQYKVQNGDRLGLGIHSQQVHLFEGKSGVALFPMPA